MNRKFFLQRLSFFCATLGGIGSYCYAPGTVATLVTLYVLYLISFFYYSLLTQFLCVCIWSLIAYVCITAALPFFAQQQDAFDPSAIVIDELIGISVTFLGITASVPMIIVGFILFRFFDIYKPFGIQYAERLPQAGGIIADDVVAGVYTLFCLHSYSWFFL